MKKRIFISVALAVLLVEVGFGVYVAFERKYESALNALNLPIDSVKEIEADTDREFEIASLYVADDFTVDTRTVVKSRKAHRLGSNDAVRKPNSTLSPVNRAVRSEPKTQSNKPVEAVRVTENREIPPTGVEAQKESPRTENRSFIAKTLSTLKKPFGWVKAIGSKMR